MINKVCCVVLLLAGMGFGQGQNFPGGSGLPAGGCTDSLSPGAQTITWTAGHTYCPNAVGTYTFASAQAVNVNNVTIFCGNRGMVLQRTGATDLFDWSGNDGLIDGCTLDGNSQSAAGTGPLLNSTGLRVNTNNIKIQNAGATNPTTATIYATAGGNNYHKNPYFAGTQTDYGILAKPPNAGSVPDVTVDGAFFDAFNPGAAANKGISADDNAGGGASVPRFRVINSSMFCQGSNAYCMGTSFNISSTGEGPSGEPIFDNDTVTLTGSVSDAFHFFGAYRGKFNVIFNANGNVFQNGVNFGDAYFNQIGGILRCQGGSVAPACLQLVDYGRNVINHLVIDGVAASTSGILLTTISGVGQHTVIGPDVVVQFTASATAANCLRIDSGTAGFVTKDNNVAGLTCVGDGSATQVGVKLTSTTGTVTNTRIGGLMLSSLATGISIGAGTTGTQLFPEDYFDTVTAQVADSGTGTFGSTHTVRGTCTLGTSCAVTLAQGGFSGTTTYQCQATDTTTAAATKVVNTSATVATFTGTGTDVLAYTCSGF